MIFLHFYSKTILLSTLNPIKIFHSEGGGEEITKSRRRLRVYQYFVMCIRNLTLLSVLNSSTFTVQIQNVHLHVYKANSSLVQ